ncbi:MAG: xanthine dehydrogenase family protein molybdopterin-binding subunit, partial [Pseudorhodobacter sp.]|nr:xanthine dehydrogenase family protein molybdopterin-binding subunit [Pseudorhodobacter sp.]
MAGFATLARRSFLIGSAAIAGGVAFGTYAFKKPLANPLLDGLGAGEAAITPYVKISRDGIRLITPRGDKGQGTYSIQAYLIAEELDVDPATVILSPGLPGPAYYNGAVLGEAVPFPAYDQSALAEAAREFMAVPAKFLGIQITGGSSTVPDAFVKLRMAGGVARETLKKAAALRTGEDYNLLGTQDGHVVLPDGSKIAYTDLAEDAARIEPVTDVELRPASAWKYLGKPMQRLDMVGKCTGTTQYAIDLAIE